MDLSLVIFLTVVAFFTYRGFKKGLLKSLSRVLSLLAGYIAAILFSKPFSVQVESWFQIQGIVAYITSALILFLGAGLFVNLVFWVLEKFLPEGESTSTGSQLGGSVIGLTIGTIVAIVIVWTFNFLNHISKTEESPGAASLDQSTIAKFANQTASKAVRTAMSMNSVKPEIANLSAAMIEAPGELTQQAQALVNSKDLHALLNDPDNQRVLDSGDVEAVRKLPALRQLASNPDMLALAKSAGMLDQTTDTAVVEAELAQNITNIWGKVQRVKNDQRVQEILADPEFLQKINSSNPLDMLSNPKLLELADIVLSDEPADENSGKANFQDGEPGQETEQKQETQIYTWTDSSGRIHYSDTGPEPGPSQ